MFLIVGLGNPGPKYDMTRHNIGFETLDYIADKHGIKINKLKFRGLCGEGIIGGQKVLLIKPQTFMNLSGQCVQEALSYYNLEPENLIVIYDDVALPVGKMRIRKKGTDGGHNGIKNIIYLLQSDEFLRIKIGVGEKAHPDMDLADHVLSHFQKDEFPAMREVIQDSERALELMLGGDEEEAMNQYN